MVMLKDIALSSAPNKFTDSFLWQNKLVQPVLLCPVRQTVLREAPSTLTSAPSTLMSAPPVLMSAPPVLMSASPVLMSALSVLMPLLCADAGTQCPRCSCPELCEGG